MTNHQIYRLVDGAIQNNGLLFNTPEQLQSGFPTSSGWLVIDHAELPADFSVDTYTIVNGQLALASDELIAERQAIKQTQDNTAEIGRLQDYLASTDYAAIKCGELGLAMSSEYPELHAERTAAHARINDLQKGDKK